MSGPPDDRDDYPPEPYWESHFEEEQPAAMPQPQQPRSGNREPYKHKTNRGSMFENDRKTKETQPDFNGTIDIEGRVYWINGWKAMGTNGKKRLSLSVQVQEERHPSDQHEDGGWGGNLPQRQANNKRQVSGW